MEPQNARTPECPSDLDLEILLFERKAGDAPTRHLEGCDHCQGRMGWMRDAEALFQRRAQPFRLSRPRRQGGTERKKWIPAIAAMIATGGLALFGALTLVGRDSPLYKTKGAPMVAVYGQRQGSVQRLEDGAAVHNGEGIRFRVSPVTKGLLLFTVDEQGKVSPLFEEGMAALPDDGRLPEGALLEGDAGPERVFAMFLPAPGALRIDDVALLVRKALPAPSAEAVRSLVRLPSEYPQATVLLERVP